MKVRITKDNWRGYHLGEEIDMQPDAAKKLSQSGIVELVKEIKKAPRDKMIRGAGKTKMVK